jgi:streptogramin lyase
MNIRQMTRCIMIFLCGLFCLPANAATEPVITQFPVDDVSGESAFGITAGPDGNIWFTGFGYVGRITPSGVATQFHWNGFLSGVATGPDGNVWFTVFGSAAIAEISPAASSAGAHLASNLGFTSFPNGITAGPDGNLWFTDKGGPEAIGRITPAGAVTEFSQGLGMTGMSGPLGGIVAGPDGNLWFADGGGAIGRITPAGVITEFSEGLAPFSMPIGIAAGSDGNLWFTDQGLIAPAIGRITPAGVITEFTVGLNRLSRPNGITAGPDGNLWFTDQAGAIGRFNPTTFALQEFSVGLNPGSNLLGITTGPDGNLWFAGGGIGRMTLPTDLVTMSVSGAGEVTSMSAGIACGNGNAVCSASFTEETKVTLMAAPAAGSTFAGWSGAGCSGVGTCTIALNTDTAVSASFVADSASDVILVSALLPTSRSVQVGAAATVFATVINASPDTAGTLCQLQPATTVPAGFFFQTTDPSTNALTGTANATVTLAPGAAQSFVLGLTPSASIAPTNIAFNFTCANAPAAVSSVGLNTLLLSASTTPTPDIVALSATANADGIVDIPGATGAGAFAIATVNVGAAGEITASTNIGAASLPVTVSICQTVPASGVCMAPPTASVSTMIAADATPTFAVFVQGNGDVPFLPENNRVFLQFTDASGTVRGSTSVAVRTQ